MKFHHRRSEEPEINLIPFIDVLLVVLIFLTVSTTYAKYTELQITLPTADAQPMRSQPKEIVVAVSADGRYSVNRQAVDAANVDAIARALGAAAQGQLDRPVIVSADAMTPTQSVINVMDAARRVGLARITFTTQASKPGAAPR
ncbi:MAG: biopolymer transporter ExbD [Burkholderiales bacterium]